MEVLITLSIVIVVPSIAVITGNTKGANNAIHNH